MLTQAYNVNETWLRTGEGQMFLPQSRTDEIAQFVGQVLHDEDDFKRRLIWTLSRLDESQWSALRKIFEMLAEENPDAK